MQVANEFTKQKLIDTNRMIVTRGEGKGKLGKGRQIYSNKEN